MSNLDESVSSDIEHEHDESFVLADKILSSVEEILNSSEDELLNPINDPMEESKFIVF